MGPFFPSTFIIPTTAARSMPIFNAKMRYNIGMIKFIKQTWNIFKQEPDVWFFYMFIATFTLSIRKIIYAFKIRDSFNEYTGVYIYLSDIFLILIFISFILYNNKSILSNIHTALSRLFTRIQLFHVEQLLSKKTHNLIVPRGTINCIRKTYAHIINNYLTIFPLFMAFFAFISIMWTTNKPLALYKSIKLTEFVLLYFYIIHIVPRGTISKNIITNHLTNIRIHLAKLFHVEQLQCLNICPAESNHNCSTWNNYDYKSIVPRGTIISNAFLIIILIGIFQSIIGISQFIMQHSIGLIWLKESIISPTSSGVAKIVLNNSAYIRAYGLFPHPNILGGYLAFSIVLTFLFFKLFHVEQFIIMNTAKNLANKRVLIPQGKPWTQWVHAASREVLNLLVSALARKRKLIFFSLTSLDNNNSNKWLGLISEKFAIVPRGTIVLYFILSIQLVGLSLTFSKSAIFGLAVGLFFIHIIKITTIVPRGTIKTSLLNTKLLHKLHHKLFHVEQLKILFLLAAIIGLLAIFIKPDLESLFIKSLLEREFYLQTSIPSIFQHPFIGLGAGQAILELEKIANVQSWQFQPVHNVLLLIANEYGIFVAFGFVFYLFKLFSKINCSTWNNLNKGSHNTLIIINHLKALLLIFAFIMLFDHYFWDIQQGTILLWLTFGMIAGFNIYIDNSK